MLMVLVITAASLPWMVLTALGAHRRGLARPLAVLTALFFPVTWAVWYLRDEHLFFRQRRHAI